MIQLNLLPDIKLDYIKAQRTQRLVISVALLASVVAVVILVLMLGIDGLQTKHLSDLKRDITSETSQLQGEPNIQEILTVQNQLESLTALHSGKPNASQLFPYLNEVTPAQVSINNLAVDFNQHTITITGTADTLSSVNAYVDTLKATTYTSGGSSTQSPAFNDIVLSSFGVNSSTTSSGQAATYTITLGFDQNIFDITQQIKLTVSNNVATRSDVSQPTDLFKDSSTGGSQ